MDNNIDKLTVKYNGKVVTDFDIQPIYTLDDTQIETKAQKLADKIYQTLQDKWDKKFEDLRTHCKHIDETNKILYNEKVQLLDKNQELQDKLLKLNDLAHEILLYELQTLDIDFDEYEAGVRDTDFSPIVTKCTDMIELIGYSNKCNKEVNNDR